ncbi:EAL domain-containing protein [Loktanella sp. R86503]|uniref:EAL domain-containing protein n=1 Tax=Loktanella sp. R86503 TaxID=3093847 RepID=UPI0036DE19CD
MPYPPKSLPGGANFDRQPFEHRFTMAFQPIYDLRTGRIFAHEALARGGMNGTAAGVIKSVTARTRYSFDRKCRIKAIAMASALGLQTKLSVNCMPNAVLDPDSCISATLMAAEHYGFDAANLIFEFTEMEYLRDPQHMRAIIASYRKRGLMTAIDNFGTCFAGLGALCDMKTDLIKIDKRIVRGIESDQRRQRMIGSIVRMCSELGTGIIAEGIETQAEFDVLRDAGITQFQGFYLGQPMLEGLRTAPRVPLPIAA